MDSTGFIRNLEQHFYAVIDRRVQGELYSELGAILLVYIVAWLLSNQVR
ncbi:MAG: hypothetical protein ACJA1I_000468 [Zhongshania marina]|jgi:hypothetical protein